MRNFRKGKLRERGFVCRFPVGKVLPALRAIPIFEIAFRYAGRRFRLYVRERMVRRNRYVCMKKINKFKENLKLLRTEQKITQQQLADLLNFSYKTLSHWETGYTEPSLDQLILVADYFRVSTDELLGKE